MVGVAGKSQACHDCRRRRVKCDLRRPGCLRCTKANLKCSGYEKSFVFVNRTPANASVTAVSVLSELKVQNALNSSLPSQSAAEPPLDLLISDLLEASKTGNKLRAASVRLLKRLYIPRHAQLEQETSHTAWSWLKGVADLTGPSPALDVSLLALSVTLLYCTGSGNATLEHGLHLYNAAIQHLCNALESPDMKVCEETLAAIITLSTCELFICSRDNGWRAHAGGICELLRLRSSKPTDASSMWHLLVSRLRTICILDAATKRRSTFLSSIEWHAIAAMKISHDPFEELMDIIACVPILLEEADLLNENTRPDVLQLWGPSSIRSLASALVKLYLWQEALRVSSDVPLYSAVPSSVSNPVDPSPSEKVFPFMLDFADLNKAIILTFSWSMMLQALDTILHLHNLLGRCYEIVPSMEEILSDDDHMSVTWAAYQQGLSEVVAAHQYEIPEQAIGNPGDAKWPSIEFVRYEAARMARYICQSMEYMHRIEVGMMGPQAMTYPIWIIRQHFRQHGMERELAWANEMRNMTGPSFRTGLKMMTFTDERRAISRASSTPTSAQLL